MRSSVGKTCLQAAIIIILYHTKIKMFRIHEKVLLRDSLVSAQYPGFCECEAIGPCGNDPQVTETREERFDLGSDQPHAAETTGSSGFGSLESRQLG